jgi:hypothetical protein
VAALLGTSDASLLLADDVARHYSVDVARGLSSAGAAARRAAWGANQVEAEEAPLWRRYLEEFKEPMILLLLASAAISLLVGQLEDAISILVVRALERRKGSARRGRRRRRRRHRPLPPPPPRTGSGHRHDGGLHPGVQV